MKAMKTLFKCLYLSNRRFDYYILKAVVCFQRLEVLMKDGDLFLIIPTWRTGRAQAGLQINYRCCCHPLGDEVYQLTWRRRLSPPPVPGSGKESHRVCEQDICKGCLGSSSPSLTCKAKRRRLKGLSRLFRTKQCQQKWAWYHGYKHL